MDIKSAAVIGSGVMGGGIAAHIANAGIPVLLLDIVPDAARAEGGDRSAVARAALDRLAKAEPAAFMHRRNARLVTPGNIEDDLGKLADVDWIIEAVVENPAVKADLYRKVDAVRKPGSVVSSNTSTIPLTALVAGQSEAFARDFLVTHFFNPPRYMRLLEVVAGERTRPEAVAAVSRFADVRLGKGVVACKDRPGFIANRIGTFWIQSAVNAAFDFGLTVEEADAVLGRPLGIPKTGVFGLLDLVGLDLMPHVAKSLLATLPPDDAYRAIHRDPELFGRMIADGYTGRKGKGGFYRVNKAGGGTGEGGDRPRHRRLPPDRQAGARQPRRRQGRAAGARGAPGQGRPLRPARARWRRCPTRPGWCRRSPTTSWRSIRPCALATTGPTAPSS